MIIKLLVLIGVIVALAVPFAWSFFKTVSLCAGLHLFAHVCFFIAFYVLEKQKAININRPLLFFGMLLSFFFPGLGIFMAILLFVASRKTDYSKNELYEEYECFLKEREQEDSFTRYYSNAIVELRREVSFESFVDIIKGTDSGIKKRVIDKLSKDISGHSVNLLKEAVRDSSPEVRLCAAGALLRIEENINEKIQLALKTTEQRGAAEDFSHLASLYQMYATIGLMEGTNYDHYMALACDAYKKSLDVETNQPSLMVDYGKCLLALKRYKHANALLTQAVRIWPNHQEINWLLVQSLFYLRSFNRIEEHLKDIACDELNDERKRIVEFWSTN